MKSTHQRDKEEERKEYDERRDDASKVCNNTGFFSSYEAIVLLESALE